MSPINMYQNVQIPPSVVRSTYRLYNVDCPGNLAAYRFAKLCCVEQVVAYCDQRPVQIWKHGP